MSSNHDLARAAAEKIDDLRDKICEDWPHEFAKIIACTYAAPMDELEKLRRQVAMATQNAQVEYNHRGLAGYTCRFCGESHHHNYSIKHNPDCPHREVAT